MKKLGKVLHVSSATGNIIVRTTYQPRVGSKVFDGERRRVGEVFDVFGPVDSPYVAVKPSASNHGGRGRILFLMEKKLERK